MRNKNDYAVKAVISDFEGIFTDNSITFTSNRVLGQNTSVTLNTKDKAGILFLHYYDIPVHILSYGNPGILYQFEREFPVLVHNLKNGSKKEKAKVIREDHGIAWNRIVCLGDDLSDIPMLKRASYAFCPKDAVNKVKDQCTVLDFKGGHGFVREVCDIILEANDIRIDYTKNYSRNFKR